MILHIYIIYIYIDHLLHVTKNVKKKNGEKNPKKKKREVTTENTALLHNVSIQFLIPLTKFGLLASTSGGGCLSAACDDCQSVIPSWTEIFFFLVNIVFIICVAVVVTIPTAANVFFFFFFLHGLLVCLFMGCFMGCRPHLLDAHVPNQ